MKLTSLWHLNPPVPERRSTSAGPRLRHAPTISTTLRSAMPPNPGATSVSSSMFAPRFRKDAWASALCIFPVRCCGPTFTLRIGGCHGRNKRPSTKSCAVPSLPHRPSYAWPSNFVSWSCAPRMLPKPLSLPPNEPSTSWPTLNCEPVTRVFCRILRRRRSFPTAVLDRSFVLGDRSRDGQTFFVRRIASFVPESRQRRFRAPLRKFEFYSDRALYRDPRRKLEVLVDQSAIPIIWDQTWNQWKHFLPTKVEMQATFVEAGKYRHRGGEGQLVKWETALPSRLTIKLPAGTAEQVETARKTYHRFGQFSDALARIREPIEREPMERRDLQRICWDLGIPGDFDIAAINWRPDYDHFFYRQLCRRAQTLYLFRNEYIFALETAVVVETPQLGHATYVFSKPSSMEAFLAAYIRTTKEGIRNNSGNIAETLGFLGRVIHGASPRAWLAELKAKIGERADCAAAASASGGA